MPYPQIDPTLVKLGPLQLRWYGLMYAISFILALFFLKKLVVRLKVKMKVEEVPDLVLYAAMGVIFGGRLGYVLFYNFDFYWNHPGRIIAIWEGGMSFHGGLLGVLVAGSLFCWKRGYSFHEVADLAGVVAPMGLFFGRIGNFINGELYGRATDVPWCMVFPTGGDICRHPSQLYQAFLEGATLFTILWVLSRKPLPRGVLFWTMIMGYGGFRFFVEFFREPDAHLGFIMGPFSMGQVLSFPMFGLGFVMLIVLLNKHTPPEEAKMKRKRKKD
ncbi:MAG TPA: prolipoprotein diacylglyceryl transferase [Nitrospiria bacterium]